MLFYKNYIFYYNVYCYCCGVFIEKYVYTKFRLDWLSELHCHLCPHHNVWPEVVYCCFTRTTLFTNMFMHECSWIPISSQSFVPQFSPVIEIYELKLNNDNNNNNKNNEMKNCEMTILTTFLYLILVIFSGPPYFDHRNPFVKTDSGLSAYYHGNADFPNVW